MNSNQIDALNNYKHKIFFDDHIIINGNGQFEKFGSVPHKFNSADAQNHNNQALNEYYTNIFNKIVPYQDLTCKNVPDYNTQEPIIVYNERSDYKNPLPIESVPRPHRKNIKKK